MNDPLRDDADDRHDHVVHFHDNDAELIAKVGRVMAVAIDQGSGVVCIARDRHIELLKRHVTNRAVDISTARTVDQIVCLDAPRTLAEIAPSGVLDVVRFAEVVGAVLDRASTHFSRVWIFGELVALMYADDHQSGAVELERLLSSFVATRPGVFLYCAYPTNAFTSNHDRDAFLRICEEHCEVLQSGGSLADPSAREN